MTQALSTDVLIVGGGIAGLWLHARLRQLGYASLLVENASLGGGQSVKSQGIIHGGAKYALHGALTGAFPASVALGFQSLFLRASAASLSGLRGWVLFMKGTGTLVI